MKFFNKKYFSLLAFVCFFAASLSADEHPWHDGGKAQCRGICEHMNALVKRFKGKKDLKMVLGAGSRAEDYTRRFKDYNFLVDIVFDQNKLKTEENFQEGEQGPFIIPLSFNSEHFFNFLKELKGSFKEIIFDHSVLKVFWTKEWAKGVDVDENIKIVFDALQPGGKFYFHRPGSLFFNLFKDISTHDWNLLGRLEHLQKVLKGRVGFDLEYKKDQPYPNQEKTWKLLRPDAPTNIFKSYSFFVATKPGELEEEPMEHNWHEANKECQGVCDHMNAIVEHFKGKKNLTMVLGAGDSERDYTLRFKDYTFLVAGASVEGRMKTKTTLSQAFAGGKREPLLIPLNFNEKYFWNFLGEFHESFKEIIFDYSVVKFAAGTWKKNHVFKIFNALQPGGQFYFDERYTPVGKIYPLKSYERRKNFNIIKPLREERDSENPFLFLTQYKIYAKDERDEVIPNRVEIIPSDQELREQTLQLLRSVGFVAQFKENAAYPEYKAWELLPLSAPGGSGEDFFQKYTYFVATKPGKAEDETGVSGLVSALTGLTNTLGQLSDTLKQIAGQ